MRLELIAEPGAQNLSTWLLGAVLQPVHEVAHCPLPAPAHDRAVGLQHPLHLGSVMAINVMYTLTDPSDPESAGVITGGREKVVEAANITHLCRQALNLTTAVNFVKRQQSFLFLQHRPFMPGDAPILSAQQRWQSCGSAGGLSAHQTPTAGRGGRETSADCHPAGEPVSGPGLMPIGPPVSCAAFRYTLWQEQLCTWCFSPHTRRCLETR